MLLRDNWRIFILVLVFFSCDEALPPRMVPQNTLAITDLIANQEAGDGGIFVAIKVVGINRYGETFQDTVKVKGNVHIWWAKRPEIEAHVPLSNRHFKDPTRISGNVLTLDPGEEFHLETFWYCSTDDGTSIIDLLDFSDSPVVDGIVTAAPEKFVLEVQLALFEETGVLRSQPHEFIIKGWKRIEPPPPHQVR